VVDSKKYTGSDEISAKVLKDTINSIIAHYFYLSIQTSSFPKMCSNCAIFQKEIHHHQENIIQFLLCHSYTSICCFQKTFILPLKPSEHVLSNLCQAMGLYLVDNHPPQPYGHSHLSVYIPSTID